MSEELKADLGLEIINKAKEFGADLAGIARVADLKKSPSHIMSEMMPDFENISAKKVEGRKQGIVEWPGNAKSALVIAIAHPSGKPELDWWILGGKSKAGNTPGNRILMSIVNQLADWLKFNKQLESMKLPYHIEHGGIYMKDTAVLAGLGCVGKNNILVTPQFGPRQRFRVMLCHLETSDTSNVIRSSSIGCSFACNRSSLLDRLRVG